MTAATTDSCQGLRPPGCQRGQASLEAVAIGIVVALLLAATAAWLTGALSLPARPPDLVGAAARPLQGAARGPHPPPATPSLPSATAAPSGPPLIGTRPTSAHRDPPIGRFLGAARRGATAAIRGAWSGLVLVGEAREAFARGFMRRVRKRAAELATNPLELLRELAREGIDPAAAFRGLGDLRGLLRYARRLRGMPGREAVLRAAEDAGEQAADHAIALLVRRGVRAGRRGRPPDGRGGSPAPLDRPVFLR